MTPGNEHLVTLETLAKRQRPVYTDACDMGITDPAFSTIAMIKNALDGLREIYGGQTDRSTPHEVSYTVRVPIERDGPTLSVLRVRVTKCRIAPAVSAVIPGGRCFFAIDFTRFNETV